ncbi:MAG TPA: response regulator [Propylenella sp.]|jgi:two-component system chemotaxis response regulator CheY
MKHCLIVDDSNSIRKVARRILEDLEFRTSEAETRRQALDLCREEMPDCVVVDWQMPDGDAMRFLGKLRALPGGNRPTVVYLTSENDPIHVARALRSGADIHMMKPFDREQFLQPLVEAGLV